MSATHTISETSALSSSGNGSVVLHSARRSHAAREGGFRSPEGPWAYLTHNGDGSGVATAGGGDASLPHLRGPSPRPFRSPGGGSGVLSHPSCSWLGHEAAAALTSTWDASGHPASSLEPYDPQGPFSLYEMEGVHENGGRGKELYSRPPLILNGRRHSYGAVVTSEKIVLPTIASTLPAYLVSQEPYFQDAPLRTGQLYHPTAPSHGGLYDLSRRRRTHFEADQHERRRLGPDMSSSGRGTRKKKRSQRLTNGGGRLNGFHPLRTGAVAPPPVATLPFAQLTQPEDYAKEWRGALELLRRASTSSGDRKGMSRAMRLRERLMEDERHMKEAYARLLARQKRQSKAVPSPGSTTTPLSAKTGDRPRLVGNGSSLPDAALAGSRLSYNDIPFTANAEQRRNVDRDTGSMSPSGLLREGVATLPPLRSGRYRHREAEAVAPMTQPVELYLKEEAVYVRADPPPEGATTEESTKTDISAAVAAALARLRTALDVDPYTGHRVSQCTTHEDASFASGVEAAAASVKQMVHHVKSSGMSFCYDPRQCNSVDPRLEIAMYLPSEAVADHPEPANSVTTPANSSLAYMPSVPLSLPLTPSTSQPLYSLELPPQRSTIPLTAPRTPSWGISIMSSLVEPLGLHTAALSGTVRIPSNQLRTDSTGAESSFHSWGSPNDAALARHNRTETGAFREGDGAPSRLFFPYQQRPQQQLTFDSSLLMHHNSLTGERHPAVLPVTGGADANAMRYPVSAMSTESIMTTGGSPLLGGLLASSLHGIYGSSTTNGAARQRWRLHASGTTPRREESPSGGHARHIQDMVASSYPFPLATTTESYDAYAPIHQSHPILSSGRYSYPSPRQAEVGKVVTPQGTDAASRYPPVVAFYAGQRLPMQRNYRYNAWTAEGIATPPNNACIVHIFTVPAGMLRRIYEFVLHAYHHGAEAELRQRSHDNYDHPDHGSGNRDPGQPSGVLRHRQQGPQCESGGQSVSLPFPVNRGRTGSGTPVAALVLQMKTSQSTSLLSGLSALHLEPAEVTASVAETVPSILEEAQPSFQSATPTASSVSVDRVTPQALPPLPFRSPQPSAPQLSYSPSCNTADYQQTTSQDLTDTKLASALVDAKGDARASVSQETSLSLCCHPLHHSMLSDRYHGSSGVDLDEAPHVTSTGGRGLQVKDTSFAREPSQLEPSAHPSQGPTIAPVRRSLSGTGHASHATASTVLSVNMTELCPVSSCSVVPRALSISSATRSTPEIHPDSSGTAFDMSSVQHTGAPAPSCQPSGVRASLPSVLLVADGAVAAEGAEADEGVRINGPQPPVKLDRNDAVLSFSSLMEGTTLVDRFFDYMELLLMPSTPPPLQPSSSALGEPLSPAQRASGSDNIFTFQNAPATYPASTNTSTGCATVLISMPCCGLQVSGLRPPLPLSGGRDERLRSTAGRPAAGGGGGGRGKSANIARRADAAGLRHRTMASRSRLKSATALHKTPEGKGVSLTAHGGATGRPSLGGPFHAMDTTSSSTSVTSSTSNATDDDVGGPTPKTSGRVSSGDAFGHIAYSKSRTALQRRRNTGVTGDKRSATRHAATSLTASHATGANTFATKGTFSSERHRVSIDPRKPLDAVSRKLIMERIFNAHAQTNEANATQRVSRRRVIAIPQKKRQVAVPLVDLMSPRTPAPTSEEVVQPAISPPASTTSAGGRLSPSPSTGGPPDPTTASLAAVPTYSDDCIAIEANVAFPQIPGGNVRQLLDEWVRDKKPHPVLVEAVIRNVVYAVLVQLRSLHLAGRCHGSVKSTNVFPLWQAVEAVREADAPMTSGYVPVTGRSRDVKNSKAPHHPSSAGEHDTRERWGSGDGDTGELLETLHPATFPLLEVMSPMHKSGGVAKSGDKTPSVVATQNCHTSAMEQSSLSVMAYSTSVDGTSMSSPTVLHEPRSAGGSPVVVTTAESIPLSENTSDRDFPFSGPSEFGRRGHPLLSHLRGFGSTVSRNRHQHGRGDPVALMAEVVSTDGRHAASLSTTPNRQRYPVHLVPTVGVVAASSDGTGVRRGWQSSLKDTREEPMGQSELPLCPVITGGPPGPVPACQEPSSAVLGNGAVAADPLRWSRQVLLSDTVHQRVEQALRMAVASMLLLPPSSSPRPSSLPPDDATVAASGPSSTVAPSRARPSVFGNGRAQPATASHLTPSHLSRAMALAFPSKMTWEGSSAPSLPSLFSVQESEYIPPPEAIPSAAEEARALRRLWRLSEWSAEAVEGDTAYSNNNDGEEEPLHDCGSSGLQSKGLPKAGWSADSLSTEGILPFALQLPSIMALRNTLDPKTELFTSASDVWQLGMMAVELADGPLPFSLMKQRVPLPMLRPCPWSSFFYSFVKMCLSDTPELRPSAEELLRHPWFTVALVPQYATTKEGARTATTRLGSDGTAYHVGGGVMGVSSLTPEELTALSSCDYTQLYAAPAAPPVELNGSSLTMSERQGKARDHRTAALKRGADAALKAPRNEGAVRSPADDRSTDEVPLVIASVDYARKFAEYATKVRISLDRRVVSTNTMAVPASPSKSKKSQPESPTVAAHQGAGDGGGEAAVSGTSRSLLNRSVVPLRPSSPAIATVFDPLLSSSRDETSRRLAGPSSSDPRFNGITSTLERQRETAESMPSSSLLPHTEPSGEQETAVAAFLRAIHNPTRKLLSCPTPPSPLPRGHTVSSPMDQLCMTTLDFSKRSSAASSTMDIEEEAAVETEERPPPIDIVPSPFAAPVARRTTIAHRTHSEPFSSAEWHSPANGSSDADESSRDVASWSSALGGDQIGVVHVPLLAAQSGAAQEKRDQGGLLTSIGTTLARVAMKASRRGIGFDDGEVDSSNSDASDHSQNGSCTGRIIPPLSMGNGQGNDDMEALAATLNSTVSTMPDFVSGTASSHPPDKDVDDVCDDLLHTFASLTRSCPLAVHLWCLRVLQEARRHPQTVTRADMVLQAVQERLPPGKSLLLKRIRQQNSNTPHTQHVSTSAELTTLSGTAGAASVPHCDTCPSSYHNYEVAKWLCGGVVPL